ncbi:MAG: biosynthetic peptidoglycan transglycosylase [Rickettsiales bacterium]|nr:biosynthetic peptidoglycan transglycosylase [Rickettsiales bacterium]
MLEPNTASISHLPTHIILAILHAEDQRLGTHQGVALNRIYEVLEYSYNTGAPLRGASTIPMQLAKNLYGNTERSYIRKLNDMLAAWYLRLYYSTPELLALYLQAVEIRPHIYGIERGSMEYFGKPLALLNTDEATLLATMIRAPIIYDQWLHSPSPAQAVSTQVIDKLKQRFMVVQFYVFCDRKLRLKSAVDALNAGAVTMSSFIETASIGDLDLYYWCANHSVFKSDFSSIQHYFAQSYDQLITDILERNQAKLLAPTGQ